MVGITLSSLQFVFCMSLIFPPLLRQTGTQGPLLKCCSGFPYTGVHMGESHLWVRVPQSTYNWLVSRLDPPVGSAQGAPSLTGPFWKHTGWCLNGWTRTGGGWNCNLFLSFSLFSVFSVPPPFTSPLVLYPHSHPFNPEYFLFVSLSFCHWGLSVQLFLQVSADIVGMVEHLCLEIQIQSSLSETPALGYFPVCFPTLCHPLGCSPPGSSVCGVFQARILVWVAFSFFRRSSQPIDWTPVSYVSCTAGRFFTHWANLVGV